MKDPADLLAAYCSSVYRVALGRDELLLHVGGRFAPPGWREGRRFALITAFDPRSLARSRADNERADAALHDALLAAGMHPLRALAHAADGAHAEPGWFVPDAAPSVLDPLALRFEQNAIVTGTASMPVRLRCYGAMLGCKRPPVGVDTRFIDWVP